jgi:hypothetical protein
MKQVSAVLTVMMVATTSLASTLDCFHGNSQRPTRIVENKPQPGTATIYFEEGGSSVLKFSKVTTMFSTRVSSEEQISKTFFHPYYEYRIQGRYNRYQSNSKPLIYTGVFISEGNSNQTITCKTVR